MWTPEEVLQEARHSLSPVQAEKAAALARPGWRLFGARDPRQATVRIGGRAPMAPEESWPTNAQHAALDYFTELDAPAFPPLPPAWAPRCEAPLTTRIRVFADFDEIERVGPARAWILPTPAGARETESPTGRPSPFPRIDAVAIPFVSLRTWEGDDRWGESPGSPWEDFAMRMRIAADRAWLAQPDRYAMWPRAPEISHVLGATVPIHDDVREWGPWTFPDVPRPDDWSVLLGLYTDLGDLDGIGAWHLVIPTADLRTGRWDRGVLGNAF